MINPICNPRLRCPRWKTTPAVWSSRISPDILGSSDCGVCVRAECIPWCVCRMHPSTAPFSSFPTLGCRPQSSPCPSPSAFLQTPLLFCSLSLLCALIVEPSISAHTVPTAHSHLVLITVSFKNPSLSPWPSLAHLLYAPMAQLCRTRSPKVARAGLEFLVLRP